MCSLYKMNDQTARPKGQTPKRASEKIAKDNESISLE